MFFYRRYQCIKVDEAVYLLFRYEHIEINVLLQDDRVAEVLSIFIFKFVPVKELDGNPYGDAERFPCLDLSEGPVGQFAEAAVIGFGAQDLAAQVYETADRVAVGVVDKDERHRRGFMVDIIKIIDNKRQKVLRGPCFSRLPLSECKGCPDCIPVGIHSLRYFSLKFILWLTVMKGVKNHYLVITAGVRECDIFVKTGTLLS